MDVVLVCVLLAIAVYLYFIPAIVASKKKRQDAMAIFVLNLFLGWTFIGWVVALVWAAKTDGVKVIKPTQNEFTHEAKSYYEPTKVCPHCAETVLAAAKVCKHCRSDLTGPITSS